jgi:hypothetical protein
LKNSSFNEYSAEDSKLLPLDEKKTAKKLRNREAAQRARDKAKIYILSLET